MTRLHSGVDHLAVDQGVGGERLVRRIAQRAGDGAALRFLRPQVQAQVRHLFAEGGGEAQVIARAAEAVGVDVGGLGAEARNGRVARQAPAAVFLGEVLQQFDIGRELVDHHADGGGAGRLAGRRLGHRAADQADLVGADLVGVETAKDELKIAPVHAHVARLQPDAVAIGDRDAGQGEVVEQVAGQSLDVDAAIAADLLAGHEAGDQLAARAAEQIGAPADKGDQRQNDHRRQNRADDQAGDLQARALLLRLDRRGLRLGLVGRGRRRVGQKAWPMLM